MVNLSSIPGRPKVIGAIVWRTSATAPKRPGWPEIGTRRVCETDCDTARGGSSAPSDSNGLVLLGEGLVSTMSVSSALAAPRARSLPMTQPVETARADASERSAWAFSSGVRSAVVSRTTGRPVGGAFAWAGSPVSTSPTASGGSTFTARPWA